MLGNNLKEEKSIRNHQIKIWIGLGFLLLVLVASLTETRWLPKDPYYMEVYRTTLGDKGAIEFTTPPYPFSFENWLSTDMLGRDVFSRLVSGAKMTFAIVFLLTMGKILVAVPLGLLAGSGSRLLTKLTEVFSFIFSGFPALLAAIFIFSMPVFNELTSWNKVLIMVIVIVLLEWSRIALPIKGRTEQIMKEPFIEGAIVLGRSKIGILYHHVWKILRSEIPVLFVFECGRSLMLIGSMALFGIYFLDTLYLVNEPLPPMRASLTSEWGTLLGESRYHIYTNPSVTFIIAGFIVMGIIALNLIGEGMKEGLKYPSPRRIRLAEYAANKKLALFAGLLLILSVIIFPQLLKTQSAWSSSEFLETKLNAYGQRLIGTEQAKDTASIIAEKWEQIGLVPVGDSFLSHKSFAQKIKNRDKYSASIYSGGKLQEIQKSESMFQLPNVSVESGEVQAPLAFIPNEMTVSELLDNINSGHFDGKILTLPVTSDNITFYDKMDEIVQESLKRSGVKGMLYLDQSFSYLSYESRNNHVVELKDVKEDHIRYFPVFVARDDIIPLLNQAESVTLNIELPTIESTIVEGTLNTKKHNQHNIVFYSYYDTESYAHLTVEQQEALYDATAASTNVLTTLAEAVATHNPNKHFNYFFVAIDGTKGKYYGFRHWLATHPEMLNENTILVQLQHESIPPQLERAGSTLATLNYNLNTQAERNAVERSLSVSAWKKHMVPFHSKGLVNVSPTFNAPVKHINLISNEANFESFVILFIKELIKEYDKLPETAEAKKEAEDQKREERLKKGKEIKDELNIKLVTALRNNDKQAFLQLQNEKNELFYSEQKRWFEEYMFRSNDEETLSAELLWVTVSEVGEIEAKIRVTIDDHKKDESLKYEVVYKLIDSPDGYKFDDMGFEKLIEEDIEVHYLPENKNAAEEMMDKVRDLVSYFQQRLDWSPMKPIVIKLYPDDSSLSATVPKFPSLLTKGDRYGFSNGLSEQGEAIKLLATGKDYDVVHEVSKRVISEMTNDNLSASLLHAFAHYFHANIEWNASGQIVVNKEKANDIAVNFIQNQWKDHAIVPIPEIEEFIKSDNMIDRYYEESYLFGLYFMNQGEEKLREAFSLLSISTYENKRTAHKNNQTRAESIRAFESVYGSSEPLNERIKEYFQRFK